ncbi:MAG: ATP-dependent DNA helicase RecG [Oscillospiraceae bacterium]|nr:ATP-dependent DNA helicase RecG [Oscillospiraceae bacterium]
MKLSDDIRTLKGIGEKRAQAFHKLCVFSLFDLASFFPRRYEDRSVIRRIEETSDGERVCLETVIADDPLLSRIRRGLEVVKFRAVDDSAAIDIVFFNQSYVRNVFAKGMSVRFYGKVERRGNRRSMTNPVFEEISEEGAKNAVTGKIVPVYRLTAGLSQKTVQDSIRQSLNAIEIPEILPDGLCREWMPVCEAYKQIHFPDSLSSLEKARRRFAFEELFVLSCALGAKRKESTDGIPLPETDFEEFYAGLPFSPTVAQRRAINEAAEDMASGRQMNRLLQGDVGSGKTLVAAALIWAWARTGQLSAFMAPTQILAEQHYRTLTQMLAPFGIRVGIQTGTRKSFDSECQAVVGTHALLNMDLPHLAFAVTDEQHRFGVEQRSKLSVRHHVLVMSATPIPRTLALVIYGDLSVSVLDELPPGRKPVETYCVDSRYHERLLRFIRKLCGEGRQVYVVCPKVEDDPDEEVPENGLKSAVEYAEQLRRELPELRITCIHGRMKADEKDREMNDFLSGEADVLVATTVIEVGVDVPNAALMLIENAERFGLSQLHQLRGRVGRGEFQSYCVLVTDHQSEETGARMEILCKTENGFQVAEEDLRLRGPGDFFGARQHGLPALHVADLGTDTESLAAAKAAAESLLREDPQMDRHAALKERVEMMLEKMNGSLN